MEWVTMGCGDGLFCLYRVYIRFLTEDKSTCQSKPYFFSSAWLCQQSSWNRNLSVVHRLSVHVAIISEPNARISFKLWLLLPLSHTLGLFFWIVEKKKDFCEYFSVSLTRDPMAAKTSKRYSSYKSQPKVLKLFLHLLRNNPHKTTIGILKFWKLKF